MLYFIHINPSKHDFLFLYNPSGSGLSSCSHTTREYHYVNIPMTFTNAQHYCRVKHTDLATFNSSSDFSRLNRPSSDTSWLWIGLWDNPESWRTMGNDSNSWRWSATGETSKTGYHNWQPGQPNYYEAQQTCVLVKSDGGWDDSSCGTKMFFF
uniref:C-type lectin domain-containing protein n=1 Tax=Lates calcarifer TaxID=8187 RepID=A0A4W6G6Z5_LATCA